MKLSLVPILSLSFGLLEGWGISEIFTGFCDILSRAANGMVDFFATLVNNFIPYFAVVGACQQHH